MTMDQIALAPAQNAIASLDGLFPHHLFSVEVVSTPMDESVLHPDELLLVKNAVAKRKGEFAAGRFCARQALIRQHLNPGVILKDIHGCPVWPHGAVGSISHTRGCIVSVVGHSNQVAGLGVDVDLRQPRFPERILQHICRPEELKRLSAMSDDLMNLHAYAIFSIKETIYKCVYMATGERLTFNEATLNLDLNVGIFHAQLTRPVGYARKKRLAGRVGFNTTHIFSGMWWLREQTI